LAELGCRLRDNRSGSTGNAVNVRSTTLERQLTDEPSERFGSTGVTADIDVSISRLKVSVGWELVELSQAQ
jgi:hypothetical protein